MLEQGVPEVLVLQADEATLGTGRVVLAGGGYAEVFVEDDQVLVQVAAGHPDSLALVRGVLRAPGLRVHGEVLDVVVVGSTGWERWVLSGDLAHRWLYTRSWDRRPDGPTVAVVGAAPRDDETSPGDGRPPPHADAVRLLADANGAPGTAHVVHVVSRRTAAGDVTGAPADHRGDPGVVAAALEEAEVVLAAWGAMPATALAAVDETVDLLRARRDDGARVVVPAHGGTVLTAGSPPQPHRDLSRRGTYLLDAPPEWLWGGPLAG